MKISFVEKVKMGKGGGMRGGWGEIPGSSVENSGIFRKFPGEYGIDHVAKSDIVKSHIKSVTIGLKEKNLAIILYPPIEYLRKCNLIRIRHLFPTTLLFFDSLFKGDLHVLLFSLKA